MVEKCNSCNYVITEFSKPRAGDFILGQEGYACPPKKNNGVGFNLFGDNMCPKCYLKYCNTHKVYK